MLHAHALHADPVQDLLVIHQHGGEPKPADFFRIVTGDCLACLAHLGREIKAHLSVVTFAEQERDNAKRQPGLREMGKPFRDLAELDFRRIEVAARLDDFDHRQPEDGGKIAVGEVSGHHRRR
jgi:hypothetical protein